MNESNNNTALQTADLEPDIEHEPVGEEQSLPFDARVIITIISHRARKHDPDGISAKAAIDGLVHAKILKDDSRDEVEEVRFKSVKCEKGEAEKTVIIIESI